MLLNIFHLLEYLLPSQINKYMNMKISEGYIFRCVVAVLIGISSILWPEESALYIVVVVGVCFIISGIFSLIKFFSRDKTLEESGPTFPLDSIGGIALGLWLVIAPSSFRNILMYILGALLIIVGLQQLWSLGIAKRWISVSWGFFVIPCLLVVAGILTIIYPVGTAVNMIVIFGGAIFLYGVCELINWLKFMRHRPIPVKEDSITDESEKAIEEDTSLPASTNAKPE